MAPGGGPERVADQKVKGKDTARRVAVFAHDFTVLGGSFSAVQYLEHLSLP